MFRNLFFAALVAALCAGLATSAFQAWRVTPLIFAAEAYEGGEDDAHVHEHGEAAANQTAVATHAHDHGEDEWAPQDGFERTAFTVVSNLLMAAGYALIIGAVSVLFNIPITFTTGLYWGVAGFAAFILVAKVRAPWALAVAVALILLPHLIAAPAAPTDPSDVPPRLTAEFVSVVLYNSAIFWVVLGLVFGRFSDYLAARSAAIPHGVKA